MNRLTTIFCSLFVCLAGIWFAAAAVGAVSAESSAPSATYTVDTTVDPAPFPPPVNPCTRGNACPLRSAIGFANANPGSTIQFDLPFNSVIALSQGELNITQPMLIDGPNTFFGQERLLITTTTESRILNIIVPENETVTIQNIAIAGGNSSQGGNIYFRDDGFDETGNLQVYSSTVRNGTALAGGNIYIAGNLDLRNSWIRDGYGTRDGAGVYADGSVTVTTSTVSNNVLSGTFNAGDGGGMFVKDGNLTVIDSFFSDNKAKAPGNGGDGGAIFHDESQGTLIIQGTTFRDNSAESQGNGGDGGAIHASASIIEISGTTFHRNQAINTTNCRGYGGALYLFPFGEPAMISQTTFDESEGCLGGAIYAFWGNHVFDDVTFTNNETNHPFGRGGAVYGAATFNGGRFSNNEAVTGGAIYAQNCSDNSPFVVNGTLFENNVAQEAGGAIGVNSYCNSFTLNNASFDQNRVESATGCGGALSNAGTTGKVSNSSFVANSATFGAAACNRPIRFSGVDQDSYLTISSSTLASNAYAGSEQSYGGAIFTGDFDLAAVAVTTVTASTMNQNSADFGGALAITGSNSTLNLINSTVSQNSASEGGGLYVSGQASAALRHNTFTINQATSGGGIQSQTGSSVNIENSVVANNFAVRRGGGGNANCNGPGIFGFGKNLDSDGSCLGFTSQNTNPQLAALSNNGGATLTHLPIAGSPVIDEAEASACAAAGSVDQRGYLRPAGTACDLGSVEVNATPTSITLRQQASGQQLPSHLLLLAVVLVIGSVWFRPISPNLATAHKEN